MAKLVIVARESGTSTGRYVDKLIEYLYILKPKFEIVILTKPHRVNFFKQISPDFTIIESSYKEFTFGEQIGLKLQLDKLSADLVHYSMVQQPVLYMGKTVTTMQDLTTVRFRNPEKNWLIFSMKLVVYKWVNKRAARKSIEIITPSEFVKEDVAKYTRINSRKIHVTYEAADNIPDKPEPLANLSESSFIMYVGRPSPHKNLYRLISAFALLKKKNPSLKLVLVGKIDGLYEKLEEWCTEQKIKDVVFTDFVSEGQLKWLYQNCEAYVFPSLSEGFGLPSLEAMQHGAPVISSNATCLPEVNGEGAIYFDPLDVNDIANKVNEVLSNSALRKKLIEKGKQQVGKYSWKRMAEQTLEVYESALESKL